MSELDILWQQMTAFLKSFFIYEGLNWDLMLVGIGLALVFGAIWLCAHWPPLFRKHWLWAVAVVSAFLTLLAVTYVQIPLQYYAGLVLDNFWSPQVLMNWLLLAAIPQTLISGLVQEGAKMVPMVFWWWRSGRKISPRLGLAIGAIAGAGFGIYEAVWVHNQVFISGWTLQAVQTEGLLALTPFWDRFWAVALHIAVSSLAGYGLASGRGWQFYLMASGLHGLTNYAAVLYRNGTLTVNQVEIYLAAVAALVMLAAIWLRWRRSDEEAEEETAETDEKIEPTGIDI